MKNLLRTRHRHLRNLCQGITDLKYSKQKATTSSTRSYKGDRHAVYHIECNAVMASFRWLEDAIIALFCIYYNKIKVDVPDIQLDKVQ